MLFARTPLFLAPGYPTVSFKFFFCQPRCHGNEFWDKIGYNSAPVKANCALFARTLPPIFGPRLSDGVINIFPLRTPVAMATNFGTKLAITRPL